MLTSKLFKVIFKSLNNNIFVYYLFKLNIMFDPVIYTHLMRILQNKGYLSLMSERNLTHSMYKVNAGRAGKCVIWNLLTLR